jgi:ribonuclease I
MRQPRRRAAAALLALLLGVAACQQAAAFDYWVLALSWSPEFCASEKGQNAREQCGVPRRSEERRVGKECRRLCRSRWSRYH